MQTSFGITEAICKPGKISNNLEKHGDDEVVVFAIPISTIVDEATANAIAGDPYFTRSIFNDNKGFLEPMPWHRKPIAFPEKYEGAVATFRLMSDEELEFADARVQDIEALGQPGGMVRVEFQLQIQPGLDRENLLLQEAQHHETRLTIFDAKVALKKTAKQRNLELVGGGASPTAEVPPAEGENYDHDAARRIAESNETERQVGEALRGLEKPAEDEQQQSAA